jgi:hypothetical protein
MSQTHIETFPRSGASSSIYVSCTCLLGADHTYGDWLAFFGQDEAFWAIVRGTNAGEQIMTGAAQPKMKRRWGRPHNPLV